MSEPISRSRAAYHRAVLRGEPDRFEVDTAAGAREAARTGRAKLAAVRSRGVDWVRPTDLLARGAGALSGRGIDAASRVNRGIRAPIGGRRADARARRLPPLSAFGRGTVAGPGQRRAGVGMRQPGW